MHAHFKEQPNANARERLSVDPGFAKGGQKAGYHAGLNGLCLCVLK